MVEFVPEQFMIAVLFVSNFIFFVFFQCMQRLDLDEISASSLTNDEDADGLELMIPKDKKSESEGDMGNSVSTTTGDSKAVIAHGGKKLSAPFTGTANCFTNLTSECFRLSLIMALTYVCEKHWYAPHSGKSYSRDLFLFILLCFFAYAYYTIKPIKDLSLLGREQTEEWKGWMQFIFLLYHYFHAEEVYNSVRVMITCYVWMTGFGNFSFFYIKKDFGWLRLIQMLWRLNFAVLLLMWTHNNTWILYYICPMHTFYFLMVYAAMAVLQQYNHTKWAIRGKIFALGIIIYIVWDVNPNNLFDFLFAWLGTEKVIGANSGSVWEYYFRTSLDHWSSYLGMIFALNFPLCEQYFVLARNTANGLPLVIAAILFAAATIYWLMVYYTKEKMQYNLYHNYVAIIPLTSYIFFRNITPYIRGFVSMSLHDLGKTTLETYLLQHHIWLTSNAKTLLTIVPGHPWINFGVATISFFIIAKELYRLTMSLRGMILPDDKSIALTNGIGTTVVFCIAYTIGHCLHAVEAPWSLIWCTSFLLFLVILAIIKVYGNKALNTNYKFINMSNRGVGLAAIACILCVVLYAAGPSSESYNLSLGMASPGASPLSGDAMLSSLGSVDMINRECMSAISEGQWDETDCSTSTQDTDGKVALCATSKWAWGSHSPTCRISQFSTEKAQSVFYKRKVLFAGDSIVRYSYHAFISLLDPSYEPPKYQVGDSAMKHSDQTYTAKDSETEITFMWKPYAINLEGYVSSTTDSVKNNKDANFHDFIVMGAADWDALNNRDEKKYTEQLQQLDASISNAKAAYKQYRGAAIPESPKQRRLTDGDGDDSIYPIVVWLQPTTISDDNLPAGDKQTYMKEAIIAKYRDAAMTTLTHMNGIIDPTSVTKSQTSDARDGVHYGEEVYDIISQMASNMYSLHFPLLNDIWMTLTPMNKKAKKKTGPYVPKKTGSMSFPSLGMGVLALSLVMLVTMDSFLGFGFLSLIIFGKRFDWEAAYAPLHKKLGILVAREESNDNKAAGDAA